MEPVSVNGVEVAEGAIAAEMQNHPAASPDAAWAAAAQALAIQQLLLQEARRQGLTACPGLQDDRSAPTEEDALIDRLLKGEVGVPDADERTCRRYYENNRQRFQSPELFEAAHILLLASPDDRTTYDAVVRQAEDLITLLQMRPEDFDELARQHSACPSATLGGCLGQVARGQTVPEFETFLFGLEPGQLCPVPVKTRFGAHVVRLDRRISGRELPFELVHDRIAEYLHEACWRRGVAQYVGVLAGQADLRGVVLAGSETGLVQ